MTMVPRVSGQSACAPAGASTGETGSSLTSPLAVNSILLKGASESPPVDTRSEPSDTGSTIRELGDGNPSDGPSTGAPEVLLLPTEFLVVVDGARVALTRTQFSIFTYFFERAGRWVSSDELIRHVLGTHHQPDTSLVRVHVHAIRRRLGQRAVWLESDPRRVRGYRWGGSATAQREVS